MTLFKVVFWITLTILTYLFLVPQQYLASEIFDWWDKLQHSLAFGMLTILGILAYGNNKQKIDRIVVYLVIYGALIEVMQSLSGWRYGEFRDWLADIIGIALAWLVFLYLKRHPSISRFLRKP